MQKHYKILRNIKTNYLVIEGFLQQEGIELIKDFTKDPCWVLHMQLTSDPWAPQRKKEFICIRPKHKGCNGKTLTKNN